jgi:hypothetical protein
MSQVLCAARHGSRPYIAMCLGGQARTFPNTIVYRSLIEHVIQPLGAHVRLFACLVSTDEKWKPRPTINQTAEMISATLRRPGFQPSHVQIEEGLWSASQGPPGAACPNYTLHPDDAPPGMFGKTLFLAPYLRSFSKQLDYKLACFRSVKRFELEHALTLTAILFARPHLTWYRPLPPWCFVDWSRPVRKLDWAYLIPRQHAEAVLSLPHAAYHSCSREFDASRQSIERWLEAFWREVSLGWRDDSSFLPAQLTRSEAGDFELCSRFQYGGMPGGTNDELCRAAVSGNPCNNRADESDDRITGASTIERLAAAEQEVARLRERLRLERSPSGLSARQDEPPCLSSFSRSGCS